MSLGTSDLRLQAQSTLVASSSSPAAPAQVVREAGKLAAPDQAPGGLSQRDWQGIRPAYEAGRHAFQPVTGGWRAHNPGHQWTTVVDGRGFLAQPWAGGWRWGLELRSYGLGESQHAIIGPPTVRVEGQFLSYKWDARLREWFVNDSRGLEHGFIIAERPPASADSRSSQLELILANRGSLRPAIVPNARGVYFKDTSGGTVLNYTGLKAWDADGQALGSRFEAAGENRIRLVVEECNARYPITIDPIAQQEAYLKASNTGRSNQFGWSVAISGDTVVVGSRFESSNATGVNAPLSGGSGTQADNSAIYSGAAYVFVRQGTNWSQQAYLKASNTGAGDNFGSSVAVSGDTIVVGAEYESSNATGVNAALSGGSGTQEDNRASWSGAAYVFVRRGTNWSQQAYLKASNTRAFDQFGHAVGISSDTVIVGALLEDSNATGVNAPLTGGSGTQADNTASASGAAYVFVREGTNWSQQAYLKPSNTGIGDLFGWSVAVSGDTVAVGAGAEDGNATGVNAPLSGGSGTQEDNSATTSGAAYVFVRQGTNWSQQAYLKASNTGLEDRFGTSVAVSGDTVVVGADGECSNATGINAPLTGGSGTQQDRSAAYSGAAYVFVRQGTTWSQQAYLKASNTGVDDGFGYSLAVSGDTVVVGAYAEASNATGVNAPLTGGSGTQEDDSASFSGAAYVFVRRGTNWSQQAYLKASNTGFFDQFGYTVTVSGGTVVVGAYGESSNARGVNAALSGGAGTQGDNSTGGAGATYVFVVTPTVRIAAYERRSTTEFWLRFTGAVGGLYHVESSENLDTWHNLGAASAITPGQFDYLDTSATPARRFYRVRSP